MSIQLQDVKKVYDNGEEVLRDVNLTIEDGEFIAIVGPSGCGKSTLLRMIAGLVSVSEGKIYINGRDVTDLPPKERDLTMVFQNYALYPFLTVKENVAFGLKARKLPTDEIERRVSKAIETVALTVYADKKPSALSGGQRQRVALARSIASEAKICLMDEPLSNLDAQLRTSMRSVIRRLQRQLGLTVVYVTHDQVEAMTMADRIVVLNDHHVQQVGTPAEIYKHPNNVFVGRFLGSPQMNILDAHLDAEQTLHLADSIKLPKQHIVTFSSTFKVGVRPEDLTLTRTKTPNACITNIEYLGNQSVCHLELTNGSNITVLLPEEGAHIDWHLNDKVSVSLTGRYHIFDQNDCAIKG